MQIHGGKENRIENNVFVDCMAAISFSPWGEALWKQFVAAALDSPEIDKTLYLARYPQLATLAEGHDVNTVTRNLAYRCAEFLRRDRGYTKATDNLTTDDDPGFADAARGVFRIERESAALKQIGFQAIPFDEIGMYVDGFRKELPVKAVAEARAGAVASCLSSVQPPVSGRPIHCGSANTTPTIMVPSSSPDPCQRVP